MLGHLHVALLLQSAISVDVVVLRVGYALVRLLELLVGSPSSLWSMLCYPLAIYFVGFFVFFSCFSLFCV